MVIYTCISGRRIKFWGLYEGYYEIYSFSLLNRQYQVHIFINKKIVTLMMSVFLPNYLLPYAKVVMRVAAWERPLYRLKRQIQRSPTPQRHSFFSDVWATLFTAATVKQAHTNQSW